MASALPVLVSDRCGCAPDLVAVGQNGFIFSPEDHPSLTSHLHAIERMGPQARTAMGQRSAEIIRGFSPRKFGHSIAFIADSSYPQGSMDALPGGVR